MKYNKFGYSLKEELANTITHSLGFFLALIGSCVIIIDSINLYLYDNKDSIYIVSSIIFSLSLILMYASSSFYHGIKNNTRYYSISFIKKTIGLIYLKGNVL